MVSLGVCRDFGFSLLGYVQRPRVWGMLVRVFGEATGDGCSVMDSSWYGGVCEDFRSFEGFM